MIKLIFTLLIFSILTTESFAAASESSNQVIKLKATIVGGKEQPRFLSIVPWKKLTSPVIEARAVNNIAYKNLTTINPDQIKMKKDLTRYLKTKNLRNTTLKQ